MVHRHRSSWIRGIVLIIIMARRGHTRRTSGPPKLQRNEKYMAIRKKPRRRNSRREERQREVKGDVVDAIYLAKMLSFQCGARGFEKHRGERAGVLQRRDRLQPQPQ